MSKEFEREQLQCAGCGHRWILISDFPITEGIRTAWLFKVYVEHKAISGGKYEEEN